MTVMTNQPFSLVEEGLYYFLEDTADAYGIGSGGGRQSFSENDPA
jgi:hypothetical protein